MNGSHQVRARWRLYLDESGQLTAVLVGSDPPIVVAAASPDELRKKIASLIWSLML